MHFSFLVIVAFLIYYATSFSVYNKSDRPLYYSVFRYSRSPHKSWTLMQNHKVAPGIPDCDGETVSCIREVHRGASAYGFIWNPYTLYYRTAFFSDEASQLEYVKMKDFVPIDKAGRESNNVVDLVDCFSNTVVMNDCWVVYHCPGQCYGICQNETGVEPEGLDSEKYDIHPILSREERDKMDDEMRLKCLGYNQAYYANKKEENKKEEL